MIPNMWSDSMKDEISKTRNFQESKSWKSDLSWLAHLCTKNNACHLHAWECYWLRRSLNWSTDYNAPIYALLWVKLLWGPMQDNSGNQDMWPFVKSGQSTHKPMILVTESTNDVSMNSWCLIHCWCLWTIHAESIKMNFGELHPDHKIWACWNLTLNLARVNSLLTGCNIGCLTPWSLQGSS